jgi:putative SOS response-associated peptidase YedK
MAGLWERWHSPQGGDVIESCAIVTTQALASIHSIHERMPVVIPESGHELWLSGGAQSGAALESLLRANEDADWMARPVSRRVNNPRAEGPDLIDPVA